MKKIIIMVALLVALPLSFAYSVELFITKTELNYWDQDRAYYGYTLFTSQNDREAPVYLIDMEGNVICTWTGQTNPKLLENGYMSVGHEWRDWDDNVVWEAGGRDKDHWWVWNSQLEAETVIYMTGDSYTNEEYWAAGADPSRDYEAEGLPGKEWKAAETDMEGNVIWEWRYIDHTIQDRNPEWPNYVGEGKTISDYPGKLDVFWKTDQANGSNDNAGFVYDWHHLNSLDYNEDLGHVAINSKHWSEFYIIDHDATFIPGDPEGSIALAASDAGDFIYRWGNPSAYQQGVAPGFMQTGDQQMWGSHNIHWIDNDTWPGGPELSGMGNFIIFNNGCYDPTGQTSSIIEINPFLDAEGNNTGWYVNPPDAGYSRSVSNQVVWSFSSREPNSFMSRNAAGCQRLPNGNTFICSSRSGHLFEVTPEGDIVWEYVNPHGSAGIIEYLNDVEHGNANAVFRAYRYGLEYPGLQGKDLTPMGTITGRVGAAAIEGKLSSLLAGVPAPEPEPEPEPEPAPEPEPGP